MLLAICLPIFLLSLSIDFCDLSLPIELRIPRRQVKILNPVFRTELLESLVDKLWSVVRDNGMRYPESTHDVLLYKLD